VAQGLASGPGARLILAGQVRLPGGLVAKAGQLVSPTRRWGRAPYPSSGAAVKLDAALAALGVDVARLLDVGASRRLRGACSQRRGCVHAVDVGHGSSFTRRERVRGSWCGKA
jgi:predicted rRNA methylase YqxC with S4 and FtsJ domains